MTGTETAASPVTRWRRIDVYADAVRWDGSPEVLAVLGDWDAEPTLEHDGPEGVLRVWGHWDRYAGASLGDWLVRDPRRGVSRLSPEDFAERFGDPDAGGFAAGTGERDACELLLDRAQGDLDWARGQLDRLAAALRESQREAAAAARLERDRIRALAVTHGALCVCRCGLGDLPDPEPGHQRMFADLLSSPEPEPRTEHEEERNA